jgi:DNA-binding MarR family transcriptional regulator
LHGIDLAQLSGARRAARRRFTWAGATSALPALGLTTAQVKVLLRLTPGEATPMRRLAQQLDYDASNLTTVVDRLAARRALERQADPADRRVKALLLTADGERLRGQFWHNLVTDARPLAALNHSDLRTLTRLLAKLEESTE